jgi:hypothetical protein
MLQADVETTSLKSEEISTEDVWLCATAYSHDCLSFATHKMILATSMFFHQ